jgi:hypothetical protein
MQVDPERWDETRSPILEVCSEKFNNASMRHMHEEADIYLSFDETEVNKAGMPYGFEDVYLDADEIWPYPHGAVLALRRPSLYHPGIALKCFGMKESQDLEFVIYFLPKQAYDDIPNSNKEAPLSDVSITKNGVVISRHGILPVHICDLLSYQLSDAKIISSPFEEDEED